jgi:hypothetical protein
LLPKLPLDEMRRIGGEQEIIARYERDKAIETLPVLLSERKDRQRLLTLLDRVLADKRVQRIKPSAEQAATLARIRSVLGSVAHLPNASRHGNGSGRTAAASGSSHSSRPLRTTKAASARRRANGTGQSRAA